MIPVDLILPLSITMALTGFGLAAYWYVLPALLRLDVHDALVPLVLPHCFRYLGLSFLIAGVTTEPLDPRFAFPAAYGDLVAALLAFAAVFALRLRWSGALPLVLLFNVVGTLDFVDALVRGLMYVPPSHMGSTYFIPMIIVPFLAVTHVIIFVVLARRRQWIRA